MDHNDNTGSNHSLASIDSVGKDDPSSVKDFRGQKGEAVKSSFEKDIEETEQEDKSEDTNASDPDLDSVPSDNNEPEEPPKDRDSRKRKRSADGEENQRSSLGIAAELMHLAQLPSLKRRCLDPTGTGRRNAVFVSPDEHMDALCANLIGSSSSDQSAKDNQAV